MSAIHNIRIVVEPIVDRFDPARYFPNIGLAQLHHCHYKGTVYYSTDLGGDAEHVIYFDRDHLHPYVLGESTRNAHASQVGRVAADSATFATSTVGVPSDTNRSDNIRSLWTGPDGTIYKLGGDYNGQHLIGQPPFPLVLWRLPPGGNWEPLLRVHSAEVAPDKTLFVLNTDHQLQRLAPGTSEWITVASDVQSFQMTKEGIVYALATNGQLIRQQHTPHSARWVLSTLDTDVRSFAVTADGAVYDLNNRNELNRLTSSGSRFVRIRTGVSSLEQSVDGKIYTLDVGRPSLAVLPVLPFTIDERRPGKAVLRVLHNGQWATLASDIQSFQLDPDGVLYALNRQGELLRSTPGGHWSLVDVDVQSFVLAPNAFRNVYVLTTHQELKRLEAGYSWRTLRTDVASMSIDSDGIVTARGTHGRSWRYWSPFTAPELDPIEGENAPLFCLDPPTRDDVLRLTHSADGPDVEVVIEPIVDTVDPPRWFGNFGNNIPASRLHHCHYQCTVYYTDANGPQTAVIEIDHDHLIRVSGPT